MKSQSTSNVRVKRRRQTYTHEFLGSTRLAEQDRDRHNRHFAGVTSQAIPRGNSHVHVITVNNDFLNHYHRVRIITGPAIPIGNGKHVQFTKGRTTLNDGHVHQFEFSTLIQQPLV